VAAPANAITISRAAEILGENETLLWEIASDMQPEDGCLWIYDTADQDRRLHARRDGIPARDAPGVQTQPVIPAVLSGSSGWLLIVLFRLFDKLLNEIGLTDVRSHDFVGDALHRACTPSKQFGRLKLEWIGLYRSNHFPHFPYSFIGSRPQDISDFVIRQPRVDLLLDPGPVTSRITKNPAIVI
jgi:hypothetical protein